MKYLRIRCVSNVRGGNLLNVRYVVVKGLTKFNSEWYYKYITYNLLLICPLLIKLIEINQLNNILIILIAYSKKLKVTYPKNIVDTNLPHLYKCLLCLFCSILRDLHIYSHIDDLHTRFSNCLSRTSLPYQDHISR